MAREPDLGLCGSTLLYEGQRDTVQALGGAHYNRWLGTVAHIGQHEGWPQKLAAETLERQVEGQLSYLIGASTLASRRFLETVGLLQDDYFLYFEELDWAARARGRFQLGYAAKSVVYHKEGSSIGGTDRAKAGKSYTADLYALKNRVRFTRRFLPLRAPYGVLGAPRRPRQPGAAAAVAARPTHRPGHAARRQHQCLVLATYASLR